ncbi:MAG: DUF779 domain-containing protein [Azospira oryzae]|nr:MAG: DUF779 domain-containing protein [Azospira oryzae]
MLMSIEKVKVTPAACTVIDMLRKQQGELMFHQSGGCCDGSQPMCFTKGEFRIGESDVLLGEVHGCEFYMARDQYEYWKHTELTLDVTEGRGASFSLEIPLGLRFIIHSRLFTEEEFRLLKEENEVGLVD